jgi:hypothetical protein
MPHHRLPALFEKAGRKSGSHPTVRPGSNAAHALFPRQGCSPNTEQAMDQRVVETPQRASQGQKPGVTRYVLTIGLALVVILFVVAYVISV